MKKMYVVLGSVTLTLGVAGIFVPLLPTTPFLLLSAWLYCKGSPKLYGWLMGHPALGTYIRNYRDRRAVTLQTKVVSLALLWSTILFCIFFVVNPLWLKIMLGVILAGVSWHLVSFRTINRSENMTLHRVRKQSATSRLNALVRQAYSEADISPATAFTAAALNEDAGMSCFLLCAAGSDVGYMIIRHDKDALRIDEMYLIPDFRGRGFGRDALVFLDYYCSYKGLPALCLSVDSSNRRAAAFYRREGFAAVTDSAQGVILMSRPAGISAKAA